MKTEKWNGIITSASEATNSNEASYQSVYRFDPLFMLKTNMRN